MSAPVATVRVGDVLVTARAPKRVCVAGRMVPRFPPSNEDNQGEVCLSWSGARGAGWSRVPRGVHSVGAVAPGSVAVFADATGQVVEAAGVTMEELAHPVSPPPPPPPSGAAEATPSPSSPPLAPGWHLEALRVPPSSRGTPLQMPSRDGEDAGAALPALPPNTVAYMALSLAAHAADAPELCAAYTVDAVVFVDETGATDWPLFSVTTQVDPDEEGGVDRPYPVDTQDGSIDIRVNNNHGERDWVVAADVRVTA